MSRRFAILLGLVVFGFVAFAAFFAWDDWRRDRAMAAYERRNQPLAPAQRALLLAEIERARTRERAQSEDFHATVARIAAGARDAVPVACRAVRSARAFAVRTVPRERLLAIGPRRESAIGDSDVGELDELATQATTGRFTRQALTDALTRVASIPTRAGTVDDVLVVPDEYREPALSGTNSFTPGLLIGIAYRYDVSTRHFTCSAPVRASSTPQLIVDGHGASASVRIRADFDNQLFQAVLAAYGGLP